MSVSEFDSTAVKGPTRSGGLPSSLGDSEKALARHLPLAVRELHEDAACCDRGDGARAERLDGIDAERHRDALADVDADSGE